MKLSLDFLGGANSGLGQTSNSIKMAALIVVPLIVPFFMVQLFLTKEQSNIYTPFVFVGWLGCFIVYYFAQKASLAEYTVFPQCGWQFSDGQQIRYDVELVPNRGEGANGWEILKVNGQPVKYSDGTTAYAVKFRQKLFYQDPKRDTPDVFEEAIWKLPAEWNESFKFNGFGELYFKGLFVTTSKAENIEVSVVDWMPHGAYRIPVCVVQSCSWYHDQVRRFEGKTLSTPTIHKNMVSEAKLAKLQMRIIELTTDNRHLNQELEDYSKHEPETVKSLTDKRLEAVQKRHGNIMNAKKSVWTKLFNLKFLGVAIILFGVILFTLWMLGAFNP